MRLDNARHEIFCQNLAKGMLPELAYAAAGFRPQRQNAHRLKTKDDIRRRVAELQDAAVEANRPNLAKVIQELSDIAFSNIGKAVQWKGAVRETVTRRGENGETVTETILKSDSEVRIVDSDKIDPATATAIEEISRGRDGSIRVRCIPRSQP